MKGQVIIEDPLEYEEEKIEEQIPVKKIIEEVPVSLLGKKKIKLSFSKKKDKSGKKRKSKKSKIKKVMEEPVLVESPIKQQKKKVSYEQTK